MQTAQIRDQCGIFEWPMVGTLHHIVIINIIRCTIYLDMCISSICIRFVWFWDIRINLLRFYPNEHQNADYAWVWAFVCACESHWTKSKYRNTQALVSTLSLSLLFSFFVRHIRFRPNQPCESWLKRKRIETQKKKKSERKERKNIRLRHFDWKLTERCPLLCRAVSYASRH